MKRIRYELGGGLAEADLESIRDQVVAVLDRVGVECPHARTLTRIAGEKGIRVEGTRVRFAPELVLKTMAEQKARYPRRQVPDEVTVTGPWNCLNIEDLDTGKIRPSTSADVLAMWRLLGAVNGGSVCPVYPHDVAGPLQVLFIEKTGLEITKTTGTLLEYHDDAMRDIAIEMYRAAGIRYRLMVEFTISPLRLNPDGLERIWRYRDRPDIDLYAASAPIPHAGSTAPLVLPGGLVQTVAETFAGVIVVDRMTDGKVPVRPEFRLELADLRHMTTAYSSPQNLVNQMAVRDVYRWFTGSPRIEGIFMTNSQRCDAQSVMDKTAWIVIHALAGFREFWFGGGMLSQDEVFSAAQYMIDLELARYATHLVRGVPYDDSPDAAVKVISEVGPGGEYLSHDTTLEHMGELFESELFPRLSVNQWRAAGEADVWHRAAAKAKGLIEGYHFALDPAVQRELDRLWAKAESLAG